MWKAEPKCYRRAGARRCVLAFVGSKFLRQPPEYASGVGHYLFNFSRRHAAKGGSLREQAAASLRVKVWGVDADEPHRDALAAGDLILIYLAEPERAFIGRAELGSAVREWTPSEAQMYRGDSTSGVMLAQVEEWDPPVPMNAVLPRLDPAGSNPYVQANTKAGFRTGVVRITAHEYETVLAVRVEHSAG
jgi:hypothetical protein